MRYLHACTILICLLFLILITTTTMSQAMWVKDGIPICSLLGSNHHPLMVADGSGGAIIVWEDYRQGSGTGMNDLYAQRVDRFGEIQWAENGVPVCTHALGQFPTAIISDTAGGAIIVWSDYRGSGTDIYAQRLDPEGNRLWDVDGVPVAAEAGYQSDCQVVADGLGGAVMVWEDNRNGRYDIYAQRLDPAGNRLWGAGGVVVSAVLYEQTDPYLALVPGATPTDAEFVIAWEDDRTSGTTDIDIYGQRMTLGGARLWNPSGEVLCNEAHYQDLAGVVPSESGSAIVAWIDEQLGYTMVHAQRIGPSGSPLWDPDGVPLNTNGVYVISTDVASDLADGIIVSYLTLYYPRPGAQRLDASGARLWGSGGVVLSVPPNISCEPPVVAADGNGGGLFTFWYSVEDFGPWVLFGQRMLVNGSTPAWGEQGMVVAEPPGHSAYTADLDNCGFGGAIFVWRDGRPFGDDYSIYAQRVETELGHWGHPEACILSVADLPQDEGGYVNLTIRASDYDRTDIEDYPATGYNVWRLVSGAKGSPAAKEHQHLLELLAGGDVAAGLVLGKDEAAALGMPKDSWESLGFYAATQLVEYSLVVPTRTDSTSAGSALETYLVSAHTTTPAVYFFSETDSGYSVDNLAPALLSGLAGTAQYEPDGMLLSWDASDAADLANYVVHRGTDPFFVPGPGNLLAAPIDTDYLDSGWQNGDVCYYKVAAVDRHENVGPYALLLPDDITGVTPGRTPLAFFLQQNHPNPFNPSTVISYGLATPGIVSLRVFDLTGRLVHALIDGELRSAGRHEEVWNGLDAAGREVGAGIYFYRLDTGSFLQTRRMVLVK